MASSYLRRQLRRVLGIPEIQTELRNLVTATSSQATQQARNATQIAAQIDTLRQSLAEQFNRDARTQAWMKEMATQVATIRQTAAASSVALASREARTATWTKETAKQIALIRETIAASSLADDNLLRTLEDLQKGDGPIIVGPWLSEIGFEILYWIPFLQWFAEEFSVAPSRVVAVSRGGVSSWYSNVAERYYEIFDHYSVEDFRSTNELRASAQSGSIKQNTSLKFDLEIIEFVQREIQLPDAKILHPSIMYSYFQPYWAGVKSQREVLSRLRFRRIRPITDPIVEQLPRKFVAAKFYSRPGSNPAPEDAASLLRFVSQTALNIPIVSMDPRLAIDEHKATELDGVTNMISVGEWMEPATNLRVQTAIVSTAEALIGTYGGFTYLPLLLGVPSMGIVAGENHLLVVHGNIMYRMAEALQGSVTALHARALSISPSLSSFADDKQTRSNGGPKLETSAAQ